MQGHIEGVRISRREMLDDDKIFDITGVAREYGIKWCVDISKGLFRELYPGSDDSAHGITYAENVGELLRAYKRAVSAGASDKMMVEFNLNIRTFMLDEAVGLEKVARKSFDKSFIVVAWVLRDPKAVQPHIMMGVKRRGRKSGHKDPRVD